jgi:hypothetical protein
MSPRRMGRQLQFPIAAAQHDIETVNTEVRVLRLRPCRCHWARAGEDARSARQPLGVDRS